VNSLFSFEFSSVSSLWSTGFPDCHKTLLNRGKWPPAPLNKKSVEIPKPLDQQEEGSSIGKLEKLLVHSIALGVKWIRTFKEELKN
jgi:hypothetical protein